MPASVWTWIRVSVLLLDVTTGLPPRFKASVRKPVMRGILELTVSSGGFLQALPAAHYTEPRRVASTLEVRVPQPARKARLGAEAPTSSPPHHASAPSGRVSHRAGRTVRSAPCR